MGGVVNLVPEGKPMATRSTLTLTKAEKAELEAAAQHASKPYLRERVAMLLKIASERSQHWVVRQGLLVVRSPDTVFTQTCWRPYSLIMAFSTDAPSQVVRHRRTSWMDKVSACLPIASRLNHIEKRWRWHRQDQGHRRQRQRRDVLAALRHLRSNAGGRSVQKGRLGTP